MAGRRGRAASRSDSARKGGLAQAARRAGAEKRELRRSNKAQSTEERANHRASESASSRILPLLLPLADRLVRRSHVPEAAVPVVVVAEAPPAVAAAARALMVCERRESVSLESESGARGKRGGGGRTAARVPLGRDAGHRGVVLVALGRVARAGSAAALSRARRVVPLLAAQRASPASACTSVSSALLGSCGRGYGVGRQERGAGRT